MLKNLKRLAVWMLISTAAMFGQMFKASLIGTVQTETGQPWNGTMVITMPRASAYNVCTSPATVVANAQVVYPVVNGNVQNGTNGLVPSSCLNPSVPYYVEFYNQGANTPTSSDNWYIPNLPRVPIDVGTMQHVNFGGPITVAVPSPLLAAPTASQVVTQPVGTSLTFNGSVIFTGTTSGITASQFTNVPTQCSGLNSFATGIDVAGNAHCSSPSSGVTTFNGRGGTVVPQTGDYTYSMIGGTPPTGFYNTVQRATTPLTQRNALNILASLSVADNSGNGSSDVGLATFGTAGTYNNPTQLITDTFGRVQSVTTATNPCGASLGAGCSYLPGGLMIEWGVTSGLSGSSNVTVSYPVAFTSQVLSVQATAFGPNDRITFVSNATTSSFTVQNNGSGNEAYWVAIGK